jgi:hypothetical protein
MPLAERLARRATTLKPEVTFLKDRLERLHFSFTRNVTSRAISTSQAAKRRFDTVADVTTAFNLILPRMASMALPA